MTHALRRGIYAITDCVNLSFPHVLEKARIILDHGATALQYRDKETPDEVRHERGHALHELCREFRVPFIVNDDPELAALLGAEGVHLGADDPAGRSTRARLRPGTLIGISCYDSLERARVAVADGASYVAFGAFHATATKTPRARPPLGILGQARGELRVPIVAIGGITPDNAGALLAAGADLLAVVSALFAAPEPALVMRKFSRLFAESQ